MASKHVFSIPAHPGCRNAIEDVVEMINNKENEKNASLITIMKTTFTTTMLNDENRLFGFSVMIVMNMIIVKITLLHTSM